MRQCIFLKALGSGCGLLQWTIEMLFCFLQTEMMEPHHTPCPQSGYLWTTSTARKDTNGLPEVGEVERQRTEEPVGGGGKHKGSESTEEWRENNSDSLL